MNSRRIVILIFLSILIFPAQVAGTVIHTTSGEVYRCGWEFWTDANDLFSVWVWIEPDEDGVKEVSLRMAPTHAGIIYSHWDCGPAVYNVSSGDLSGDGVVFTLNQCMTETFLLCRTNWANFSLTPGYILPEETSEGDLMVVTCDDQQKLLYGSGGCAFNTYMFMCGGAPTVRSCRQIEDDRIRVVFGGMPLEMTECGEDYTQFRVIRRMWPYYFAPSDTIEVVAEEFDSTDCPYWYECDSLVAVFTLESPLDPRWDYAMAIDGFGSNGTCTGGLRYVTIEPKLIPVATLLEEFSALCSGDRIEISWSLSSQDDGFGFLVERSDNGGDFVFTQSIDVSYDVSEYRVVDDDVRPGETYIYRVSVIENGETQVLFETESVDVPSMPMRLSNHPNPFNPSTVIEYSLPSSGLVSIAIYDVNGRIVRHLVNRDMEAGAYNVDWNGLDDMQGAQPSGVYFCKLRLGKTEVSAKLVLLR